MNVLVLSKSLSDVAKSDIIVLVAIAVLTTVLMVFVGYKLLQMLHPMQILEVGFYQ